MNGTKKQCYVNVLERATTPLRLVEKIKDEIDRIKHRDPQELRECLDGVQLAIAKYFETEERLATIRREYYDEPPKEL